MGTSGHDVYSIFREIGSVGLVIFERDGLLLRRNPPSRDLMLGDINGVFVEMLKQLRALNLRFGFISDQSGMGAGSHGKSEAAALIKVLDQLLVVSGTIPDFWMAGALPRLNDVRLKPRNRQWQKTETDMILRAIERYGVDTGKAVFVGGSTSIVAASNAGITGIHYAGWPNNRASFRRTGIETRNSSTPELTEVRRLRATIEQILGLDHRAENSGMVTR